MIDISIPLDLLEARFHKTGDAGVIEVCCPAGRSVLSIADAKKLTGSLIGQLAMYERIKQAKNKLAR